MQPSERDLGFIWDMNRYAERVVIMAESTHFAAYCGDWVSQLAMERALEVIGEAANRVSTEFRNAHPEIPWQQIISHRHFLAHEYDEIKHERIWETATVRTPELIRELKKILSDHPTSDA